MEVTQESENSIVHSVPHVKGSSQAEIILQYSRYMKMPSGERDKRIHDKNNEHQTLKMFVESRIQAYFVESFGSCQFPAVPVSQDGHFL